METTHNLKHARSLTRSRVLSFALLVSENLRPGLLPSGIGVAAELAGRAAQLLPRLEKCGAASGTPATKNLYIYIIVRLVRFENKRGPCKQK